MENLTNLDGLRALATSFVENFGLKLVLALAIFIVGRWLAMAVTALLRRVLTRADADRIVVSFVANIVYSALLIAVVLAALNQLGVQTTSFIAIVGAAGLAIGLALKDSLSNFAAGVMVILFRPFRVGDFIQAAGVEGLVDEVQLFTTTLRTVDNRRVIVPNNAIMSDTITNFSANSTRRIDLVVGTGYNDDVDAVKTLLTEIVTAHPKTLTDPAPVVALVELADSSINYAVRPWVETSDYFATRCELLETIKRRFDTAGIDIPYPQSTVHLVAAPVAADG